MLLYQGKLPKDNEVLAILLADDTSLMAHTPSGLQVLLLFKKLCLPLEKRERERERERALHVSNYQIV